MPTSGVTADRRRGPQSSRRARRRGARRNASRTPWGYDIAAVEPLWDVVDLVLGVAFMAAVLAGLVSTVLRFRAARGAERQQMRWLASGATVLVGAILSGPLYLRSTPEPSSVRVWTTP